ncbi:hypothetical protein J6590_063835 [Homalodisca vitripennis]|nr:hypothetical protein J6590_063835 [Homalodisca vitripennis]
MNEWMEASCECGRVTQDTPVLSSVLEVRRTRRKCDEDLGEDMDVPSGVGGGPAARGQSGRRVLGYQLLVRSVTFTSRVTLTLPSSLSLPPKISSSNCRVLRSAPAVKLKVEDLMNPKALQLNIGLGSCRGRKTLPVSLPVHLDNDPAGLDDCDNVTLFGFVTFCLVSRYSVISVYLKYSCNLGETCYATRGVAWPPEQPALNNKSRRGFGPVVPLRCENDYKPPRIRRRFFGRPYTSMPDVTFPQTLVAWPFQMTQREDGWVRFMSQHNSSGEYRHEFLVDRGLSSSMRTLWMENLRLLRRLSAGTRNNPEMELDFDDDGGNGSQRVYPAEDVTGLVTRGPPVSPFLRSSAQREWPDLARQRHCTAS